MNGENVYYEIPAGVKILNLKYRETGYDSEFAGNFKCDDTFFTNLWKKARRSLYVNMRDSYMDCPNRERAQWIADMNIEMLETMYCMDTNAYALYEKGIRTLIGWRESDVLLAVSPVNSIKMHLPFQGLAVISGLYNYYEYTGKKEFIEYVYPYAKNYLELWEVQENGLVSCTSMDNLWKWGDSSENVDYEALENAWYYLAMTNTQHIAEILNYEEDKIYFSQKLQNLKERYNQIFWTENGYKSNHLPYYDGRANAIAIISGLADSDKYEVIKNILINEPHASPYMESYILEALCEINAFDEVRSTN